MKVYAVVDERGFFITRYGNIKEPAIYTRLSDASSVRNLNNKQYKSKTKFKVVFAEFEWKDL